MIDSDDEIRQVLSQSRDEIPFEELPGEEFSPLNQPVVEKNMAGSFQERSPQDLSMSGKDPEDTSAHDNSGYREEPLRGTTYAEEPLDAPEQHIDETYGETAGAGDEEKFEVPGGHAKQAADTILGVTNNMLEIGGGYFVKIRKHRDFIEFEEIIERLDRQNTRNIKRIKLDSEDKALLRPLLITMLKAKAQKLTPEQQMIAAIISILVKKTQMVMQVRAENNMLVDQFREIVREDRAKSKKNDDDKKEHEDEPEDEPDTMSNSTQGHVTDVEQVLEVAYDEQSDADEKKQ